MNSKQRAVLIAVAIAMVLTALYVPERSKFGVSYQWLFGFLFAGPVDIALLAVEWVAICIVGAIGYVVCGKRSE